MHLVLATQRPAGAVSAHLRANLSSRVCFRVATDADSVDVIDAADAARIDPAKPGTCYVASSGRPRRVLRTLPVTTAAPAPPCVRRWPNEWDAPAPGPVPSREQLAEAIAATASVLGHSPAVAPWLPALPHHMTIADIGQAATRTVSGTVPDTPDATVPGSFGRTPQRRTLDDAGHSHPGATDGAATRLTTPTHPRSDTLDGPRSHPSAAAGDHPHGIRVSPHRGEAHRPAHHGEGCAHPPATAAGDGDDAGDGIVIGLSDLPETQRQVPLILRPRDGHVLVVGGPRSGRTTTARTVAAAGLERGWAVHVISPSPEVFADLTAHDGFGTLVGPDDPRRLGRLARLLRHGPGPVAGQHGLTVLVVDGSEVLGGMMLPGFEDHPLESLASALPGTSTWIVATCLARHATGRWAGHFPARLVLATIDRTEDITAGVGMSLAGVPRPPGRAIVVRDGTQHLAHIAVTSGAAAAPALAFVPPIRLAPLPERVSVLPPPRRGWAWFGYGGDDAGPIGIPLAAGRPVGVIGPPGSGRTTVLESIAAQCAESGTEPLVLDAAEHPAAWRTAESALEAGATVIVDNLDQASPAPHALPTTGTLIAALTTGAAGSFHGAGPLLRARPCGIVLMPAVPGSAEAFGVRLTEAVDPRRARKVGFGIVVTSRGIEPVQTPFLRGLSRLGTGSAVGVGATAM
jgi:S-DNA-T family DNA segregation ATPase FtsK/SpoIIIE